jgi:REP element-mobilizing transposase RayT
LPRAFKVNDNLADPYFITNTVIDWLPVFNDERYCDILLDSLAYCVQHRDLRIHGYVIMPTHSHAICSHPEGKLSDVMRDFKRFTSRSIVEALDGTKHRDWLAVM